MRLTTRKDLIAAVLIGATVAFTLVLGGTVLAAQDKDVNVVNTPSVNVTNTPDAPVQVEALNDALNQPYIRSDFTLDSDSQGVSQVLFRIPGTAYKTRLVIETAAVEASVPAGQKVRFELNVGNSISTGDVVNYTVGYLQPVFLGTFGSLDYYVVSQQYKVRLDHILTNPYSEIQVRMLRSSTTGSVTLGATIYGYLVDLP